MSRLVPAVRKDGLFLLAFPTQKLFPIAGFDRRDTFCHLLLVRV
jgi:hypothetical protein